VISTRTTSRSLRRAWLLDERNKGSELASGRIPFNPMIGFGEVPPKFRTSAGPAPVASVFHNW